MERVSIYRLTGIIAMWAFIVILFAGLQAFGAFVAEFKPFDYTNYNIAECFIQLVYFLGANALGLRAGISATCGEGYEN